MLKWLQRTIWPLSEIWRLNNRLKLALAQVENLVKRNAAILDKFAECQAQVAIRESIHEQEWLKNAGMQANVDFGFIDRQVEIGQRVFNSERQCAKECYRQGYGYREFPNFLALYEGRGLRQERYWRGR